MDSAEDNLPNKNREAFERLKKIAEEHNIPLADEGMSVSYSMPLLLGPSEDTWALLRILKQRRASEAETK